MPRYALEVQKYPEVFFQILGKRPRQPARIRMDHRREADALRFKFYGFKRALSQGGPQWTEVLEEAEQTMIRIEDSPEGSFVIFEPVQRVLSKLESKLEFLPVDYNPDKGKTHVQARGEELLRNLGEGTIVTGPGAVPPVQSSEPPKSLRQLLGEEPE